MAKKVENVAPAQEPATTDNMNTENPVEKKSKLWLWIVIALIVIGVIAVAWLLI